MRPAAATVLALAVALLIGCGGSGSTTPATSVPENGVSSARELRSAWERAPACRHPRGASRWSCPVGSFRCQGVVTDPGWTIDCAEPGRSVAFTVRRP